MALLKALCQNIEQRRFVFGAEEGRPLRGIVTTPQNCGESLVDAV